MHAQPHRANASCSFRGLKLRRILMARAVEEFFLKSRRDVVFCRFCFILLSRARSSNPTLGHDTALSPPSPPSLASKLLVRSYAKPAQLPTSCCCCGGSLCCAAGGVARRSCCGEHAGKKVAELVKYRRQTARTYRHCIRARRGLRWPTVAAPETGPVRSDPSASREMKLTRPPKIFSLSCGGPPYYRRRRPEGGAPHRRCRYAQLGWSSSARPRH